MVNKLTKEMKYPNSEVILFPPKIAFTAMTFFRRYYLKNPCILEHSPYHMLVVCIFLAAKVEERTDINLHGNSLFYKYFYQDPLFAGLYEKPPNQSTLVKLCRDHSYKQPNAIGHYAKSDGFERFRYLEVELCQTLGFNLYVHNPLSVIHHVRFALLEHFKDQP